MPRREIDTVVVVIPAHDEELTLAGSIAAVRASARALAPGVATEVVVVANGCRDRTAEVALAAGTQVLESPTADVGAARAAGAAWALSRFGVGSLWIATTDADTLVPVPWLPAQLAAATRGADAFIGTVALEPADAARHPMWVADYATAARRRRDHGHVHGASLGVRADRYRAVGGFRAMSAHEDRDLVERLLRDGARVVWADDVAVLTSARRDHRAPMGVGADLAASG